MGWQGPGEHEGWVVPLFADGVEGAGASGSRGVMVGAYEADEWRPDALVTGYRAGCECGWRGPVWMRVQTKAPRTEARLLAVPGPFHDLADDDEGLVMEAWREHVAPARRCEDVEDAATAWRKAGEALDEAVRAARAAGASWADVGRAARMTRQSANERWARLEPAGRL